MSVRASTLLPFDLLGRHVWQRPEEVSVAVRGEAFVAHGTVSVVTVPELRETEIEQLHAVLR